MWVAAILATVFAAPMAVATATTPPAEHIVMLHDGETHRSIARDETTGHAEKQDVAHSRTQTAHTTDALVEVGESLGATVTHVYDNLGGFSAELDEQQLAELRAHPAVAWVEADAPATASAHQSPAPWDPTRVNAAANAGDGVTAYVIDTGIRADHVEFTGRVLPGYSSINDGRGTDDCHGHGTAVTSLLAGATYGIAQQADIIPVRSLDCASEGTVSSLIDGIDWVTQHASASAAPAVANLSVEALPSASFDAAVQGLIASGVPTIVAAGNGNESACNVSPARVDSTITVANAESNGRRHPTSNHGPCVDLFALGTRVTVADINAPTAHRLDSGSSFAAPQVAGAAALLLQNHPEATPEQVKQTILSATTPNAVRNLPVDTTSKLLFIPTEWELQTARPAPAERAQPSSMLSSMSSS